MVERRMLLYWPHPSALVAYDGGTDVGHRPVRTLFLEPDFVPSASTLDVGHGRVRTLFLEPNLIPSAGTLDVGHGRVRTLFLGLILCLVPMTPCDTMSYWPSPN